MDTEKTFRTKTGYCHILPDKIVLTRDGVTGSAAEIMHGNTITRTLVIYGIIAVTFFYFAYNSYQKGESGFTAFYLVAGIFLIYGVVASRNNAATPVIERRKIKKVVFKKAIPYLTRSRFEVYFEDDKGKVKRRLIMLPGSLSDGQEEAEKALKIMREEGFIR